MKLRPALATLALAWVALPQAANAAGLVISQFYGAGGNSGATYLADYVELRNAGTTAVTLGGKSLQYASATGTGLFTALPLNNVTLAPGQHYLVQLATGAAGLPLPLAPDQSSAAPNLSGTSGKLALVDSATALACNGGATACSAAQAALILDLVGYGSANYFEGSAAAPTLSATTAGVRAAAGCTDSNHNAADFAAAAPQPHNYASSYAVCSGGAGGGGGGASATAASIPQIQGPGGTSPLVGSLVQTSGVVTKVNNNGFFMQDLTGDGNPLTSDGIFVFTSGAPTVAAGQLVQLTATVTEFNVGAAGNAATAARTVTELVSPSGLAVLGTGYSAAPMLLNLPVASLDELERVEGMLVTINGPLTVSQNYFQGRYGQVTLSAGGRMETPTNRHRPGTAQALALADLNARAHVLLDDGTSVQNPNPTPYLGADDTLRSGDTVASVTGVIDYGLATSSNTGLGDYKLHPTQPVVFDRSNPRTTAPPSVDGNLKLASFNVLNYFTTFTDGTDTQGRSGQGCSLGGAVSAANCRGADNAAEFARQRAKIVEAIAAINADVLGLMEIQNNGMVAVQDLVDALNARMGAGTYAAVPEPATGMGSDAIKLAMVYKPARLGRVGAPLSDTDAVNNRPPLAQTFAAANGERFTLVVNHLKSKGSCPATGDANHSGNFDAGDGQGCWNGLRVQQAQRLVAWLGTLAAATPNQVLLGDFNAYAQEDPIATLTAAGLVDQIGRHNGFGYSYVFDGAAGRLDHGLSSAALSGRVGGALEWHINADEPSVIDYNTEFKQPACATCGPDHYSASPYRSSDHDPVVVGLHLWKLVQGTAGRDTLLGTPGDDLFLAGPGADTLTGGGGTNAYAYNSLRDAADTITDFVPGRDFLDLRNLFTAAGWALADPVGAGVLRLVDTPAGAALQIDADGPTGPAAFRTLVTLRGVSASQVQMSHDILIPPAVTVTATATKG